jgi:hypothetical protein
MLLFNLVEIGDVQKELPICIVRVESHFSTLKGESADFFETLVNFSRLCDITAQYGILHSCCHENPKSQIFNLPKVHVKTYNMSM